MKTTLVRLFVLAAFVIGIMLTASSCGSQKMGCPGSITKADAEQPAHS